MLETLSTQLAQAGLWDWIALLASLAYVLLAARSNNWCWLFAAIGTTVWAYQSYFVYNLVSDALLQVFYLIMAGVGLWQWRSGTASRELPVTTDVLDSPDHQSPKYYTGQLPVTTFTPTQHLLFILFCGTCGLALGYFFDSTLQAAATYPDAVTTAFSVGTTFLLVRRKLENWLYWVVIDAVYVWIYLGQEALLFAVMMVINIVVAVYGYANWRQERKANTLF